MRVAPFRALTHFNLSLVDDYTEIRRNAGRPFQGIDTASSSGRSTSVQRCRNEGRPFQGIDTFSYYARKSYAGLFVEMSAAPIQGLNTRVITISTT